MTNSDKNDGDDLKARFEKLQSSLAETTAEHGDAKEDAGSKSHDRSGIAQAFRLSSEFIAGVVVGAGIGYGVDTFFGTSPWGIIIFLMLGFAAAVLNVMRAAGMVAESEMRLKPAYELQKKQQDEESDSGPKK